MTGEHVTAIILAGGQSSRFGGVDKGFVEVQARPMIEHVLEALKPQVNTILISANRHIAEYQAYGYPVIEDAHFAGQGPLAGIVNCLPAVKTDLAISIPCDMPFLPDDLLETLLKVRKISSRLLQVPVTDQLQSGVVLMPTSVRESIEDALKHKQNAVRAWLSTQEFDQIDFKAAADRFKNINAFVDIDQI